MIKYDTIDKNGKIIWKKYITNLIGTRLSDLYFLENPIEVNSVAAIAHLSSTGEKLTLYLKKDGNFMFYFHSW